MNGAAKSGKARTGADVTAAFRAWNAATASGVQENPSFNRAVSGAAMMM
jgi:hypothetical protein